ncbi:carboxymuconolactone decarboxylase family protein [Modestobacter sp. VKM Ac-2984]|uniref:carboxymuconolactone decarboxylase family protein n=1 Tax=Modestobacter sp. VKM Ac-2984 TaxID=3004138 RepID=UPI0022AACFE9|nr:carboxymuconolactone decarboxylase family protein [Modestobacter sp. VKM Ac-2984]MCZ2816308.1 carboxymuconolactone decarboxylase family protein [Modestobacter sp. VKM Ac-2984]
MTSETPDRPAATDRWSAGGEVMDAVYGPGFSARLSPTEADPWLTDTVEHLFGEVWARPGLSIRDRRLLVIGATAALGREDLLRVQVRGGLRGGEFDADGLQEVLLQLAYYVGWGNATALAAGIRAAIADVSAEAPPTDSHAQDDADTQDEDTHERGASA